MPISALPQSTVCTLHSTQSLIDPTAVIKELIDNSLDAGATSITIEVSQNLLDIIQAKDNGCGIAPPDRQLIARRHCTSKIANEHDLTTLGGRALGFRGEALANAAEMSRKLVVTTRIEGELVGTALTFANDGSVRDAQPKAHAVGTTTRVEDFLYAHPVRKQLVSNQRQRILSRIHGICKAYAAARSGVRISISVLKTRKQHENCVFASRASESLEEIAIKLVGQAVSAHSLFLEAQLNGVRLSAILQKADSDQSCERFVSIDGRPLSNNSSICTTLLKTMKQHTGWSKSVGGANRSGFIIIRIACSSTTYDVNIEPAKDDVQFEDITALLAPFKLLLDQAYPHDKNVLQEIANDDVSDVPNAQDNTVTVQSPLMDKHATSMRWPVEEVIQASSEGDGERGRDLKRVEVQAFNPWTVAKINTSLSPNKGRPRHSLVGKDKGAPAANLITGLITPEMSPVRRVPTHIPPAPTEISQPRNLGLPEASLALPSPVKSVYSPQKKIRPMPPPLPATSPSVADISEPSVIQQLPPAAPPSNLLSSKKPQRVTVNKPFKPQRPKGKDPEKDAWFDIPQMRRDEQIRNRMRKSQQTSQATISWSQTRETSNAGTINDSTGNMGDIRMFMERKGGRTSKAMNGVLRAASATQHLEASEREDQRISLESLHALGDEEPLIELDKNRPSRPPTRAKSDRSRRTKSSMLPLERTPAEHHVQNLSLTMASVSRRMNGRLGTDDVAAFDADRRAELPGLCGVFTNEELTVLAKKVKELVQVSKGHKFPLGHPFERQIMEALKSPMETEEVEEEMLMC